MNREEGLGGRPLSALPADTPNAAQGYRYEAALHTLHIFAPCGKAQTIRIVR